MSTDNQLLRVLIYMNVTCAALAICSQHLYNIVKEAVAEGRPVQTNEWKLMKRKVLNKIGLDVSASNPSKAATNYQLESEVLALLLKHEVCQKAIRRHLFTADDRDVSTVNGGQEYRNIRHEILLTIRVSIPSNTPNVVRLDAFIVEPRVVFGDV